MVALRYVTLRISRCSAASSAAGPGLIWNEAWFDLASKSEVLAPTPHSTIRVMLEALNHPKGIELSHSAATKCLTALALPKGDETIQLHRNFPHS